MLQKGDHAKIIRGGDCPISDSLHGQIVTIIELPLPREPGYLVGFGRERALILSRNLQGPIRLYAGKNVSDLRERMAR